MHEARDCLVFNINIEVREMIESIRAIIEQHSAWHLVNVAVLLLEGIILILIGWLALAKKWQIWIRNNKSHLIALHFVLIAGGVLIIVCNLINLFGYGVFAG